MKTLIKLVVALASIGYASALYAADLQLKFIGQATFPTGYKFQKTIVGGLSGIDYDPASNLYYTISDDRSRIGDARFYTLAIDLLNGKLEKDGIKFINVTSILNENGESFSTGAVDPESIRFFGKSKSLYWTSEGDANKSIAPVIRQMALEGKYIAELPTPDKYLPGKDVGIRNNLSLENLTFSRDQKRIFIATENALKQDGPKASLKVGSPIRILEYDLEQKKYIHEYVYNTEPVAAAPKPKNRLNINGLVEILAIGEKELLTLERSYSSGVGNSIKIFRTSLKDATDVKEFKSLSDETYKSAEKKLVLDLGTLGIKLDNLEGITFGPRLSNGERTLVLVSDNNFSKKQFTQFLAFSFQEPEPKPVKK